MTLADAKRLVDHMNARLSGRPVAASELDLASAYTEACRAANQRLAQCARMIEDGSALQALLFAEEKPPLMDLLGVLGFSKQRQWLEFCGENSLPLPMPFDRHALNLLNDLYASGRKADQTKALYHDFRGAMATKDEARALDVIRAITRLDPADADAASELARLERKAQESAKANLEKVVAAGDEGAIIRWLDRCEALEVADCEALMQGREVRASHLAAEAARDIRSMIAEMPQLRADGFWQQCGERASRIRSMAETHGIALASEDASVVAGAMQYFEEQRSAAIADARFRASLDALAEGVETLQGMRFSAEHCGLQQIEADMLSLRKLYEAAKAFDKPIPESTTQAVAQLASSLDVEAQRLRKMKRLRRVSATIVVIALIASAGTFGYLFYRAGSYASEIRQLRERGASVAVHRLVYDLRARRSLLLQFPKLSSAVIDAEQWLGVVETKKEAARIAVTEAQKVADANFANIAPGRAIALFQQVAADLDALPSDAADPLRVDFAKAEKKLALWLPEQRNERAANLRKILGEIQPQLAELTASKNPSSLEEHLVLITPRIESVQSVLDDQAAEVSVPAALQAEAQAAVDRVHAVRDLLQTYRTAIGTLASATDTQGYMQAVQGLAKIGFPGAPDVQAAQKAALRKLDAGHLLGQLILPTSPEAWVAATDKPDFDKLPLPETPRDGERDILISLINEPNLADIREAKVVPPAAVAQQNFGSGRRIFSKGELSFRDGAPAKSWAGTVYDPSQSASSVVFVDSVYTYRVSPVTGEPSGDYVSGGALSKASEALRSMKLGDLVNPDGSKYRQSILPILDRVRSSKDCPPLVQAYVLQELGRIAQIRSGAWGLAWAPAYQQEVASLREAAGGQLKSEDWMLPSKASLADKVKQVISSGSTISYETQAKLHRRLAASVLGTGLQYRGFVGADGRLVSSGASPGGESSLLWGFQDEAEGLVPVFSREGSGEYNSVTKAAPLTPVFAIQTLSKDAVQGEMRGLGIDEDEMAAYSAQLPPLFKDAMASGTSP
ncbi:MAG: hypothetical protein IAE97_09815 [Chthoniobacterales bacterium]|nr:hypothetical protein [Chthoniobacterales bacterium]